MIGAEGAPMIRTENLRKVFRVHEKAPGLMGSVRSLFAREWIEKEALKGVSLEIASGELVGLIGANGAGKTTLVKILTGIIHPTSGTASVLGYTPWHRKNDYRRQISLIMGQKAQLWWDLPAADCFLLLREIYEIPTRNFDQRLAFLAETLDVNHLLNIQVRRLSLGERMKMELIAALLHEPRVVYLDEPTIGLDLTAQRAIRNFILDYRQSHQPAMILTSHYMEDIERLCKRIVIIRQGEIVYDGSLKRVIEEYATQKLLTLHLSPHQLGEKDYEEVVLDDGLLGRFNIPEEHAEIDQIGEASLRLKVRRDCVPEVASQLLQKLPVMDLSIDEEDIGTVIEALQQGHHG